MSYIIFVILLYLAIGLQNGFLGALPIFGGVINLVILVLVSLFFLDLEREGLIFALILAIFWDFYGYSFFLVSSLGVFLIFYLLVQFRKKISEEASYMFIAVASFFVSLLFDLIVITSLSITHKTNFTSALVTYALPNALIALIVSIPFFLFVKYIVGILRMYQIIKTEERKIEV